jgi:hypothetical protein
MARAPVSKTGGWGFESLHSCQFRMTDYRWRMTDFGWLLDLLDRHICRLFSVIRSLIP